VDLTRSQIYLFIAALAAFVADAFPLFLIHSVRSAVPFCRM
jgi:hypothetical protein